MLGGQKLSEFQQPAKQVKFLRTKPLKLAQKSTKLSENMTSKLRKCPQGIAIFKNSSADGGSVTFWGAPAPKLPQSRHPCLLQYSSIINEVNEHTSDTSSSFVIQNILF